MKKNILVFPCGSEIGLEVFRSLQFSKDFNLIGASSVDDHGMYVYKDYIGNVPFVDADNFIPSLNDIIKQKEISFIIPAHDSVVIKLVENADKVKARIVTSSFEACNICRSKKKTYEYFKNILNVPKIYQFSEIKLEDFPIFLKPDVGQGSKGTQKINNFEELNFYYKDESQLLLEYLPFDEFSIDCFTNYKGELLYCSGRKRNRISNGISVSTIEVEDPRFLEMAMEINNNLRMNGAWFYQVKENKNRDFVLLEIAPRVAGTMEYQRAFGVSLPILSVYNAQETDVSILKNNYRATLDRALNSKFKIEYEYNSVYIDLDDVIIQEEKVNYLTLSFLYKCLNEGKKLILLTRHKTDPLLTLDKYKIYNLFDEIVWLKPEDLKSAYIKEKKAIFIDDSHKERTDVYKNCNIPVFDINMIDVLL